MEIAKGVHLIETYANCALFTDGRLVLCDTSVDDTAKDIFNWLRKKGRAPGDLTSVVVTHPHPHPGPHAGEPRAPRHGEYVTFETNLVNTKVYGSPKLG